MTEENKQVDQQPDQQQEQAQIDPQIEKEARLFGWVPKEEFRGSETDWVDADVFVKRGKEINPILRKNNELLMKKLDEKAKEIDSIKASVEEFKKFRIEAADVGIRNFLEVFNPNKPTNLKESDIPSFVNDHIIRNLAGVTVEERPIFLKIAYNGAKNLQELAGHDKSVVVGVLGGSAGTTRDALELLSRAEEAGGRGGDHSRHRGQ